MKRYQLVALILIVFVASCKNKAITSQQRNYIDMRWIDSIVKNSDSSYRKNYYRTDFVTAEYFISKKDSGMLQIMKDSLKKIRKLLLTHKRLMKRTTQFYANGQLITDLLFDDSGRVDGKAISFYSNGQIKTAGQYKGGVKVGKWSEFLEDGKELVSNYDTSGIIIKAN